MTFSELWRLEKYIFITVNIRMGQLSIFTPFSVRSGDIYINGLFIINGNHLLGLICNFSDFDFIVNVTVKRGKVNLLRGLIKQREVAHCILVKVL